MRRLIATVILGLVTACLLVLPAAAGENCDTFENHSGQIPGSYDYAEFFEDGQLVTTVETGGEDIFVNPAGWGAGEDWDQVNKCHTTIVPPTVTADCLTLTVDAAEDQIVGVQIGDGFVEFEGSDSFVGEAGQPWAVYYNDQVLASGVFEECDTTTTTTEITTTSSSTTITTLPEEPNTTTTAPPQTTTSLPSDTTTTTPATLTTVPSDNTTTPELPFTGPAGLVGLLVAGFAAVGIGTVLVREFRSE